jgi:hypothetical protein
MFMWGNVHFQYEPNWRFRIIGQVCPQHLRQTHHGLGQAIGSLGGGGCADLQARDTHDVGVERLRVLSSKSLRVTESAHHSKSSEQSSEQRRLIFILAMLLPLSNLLYCELLLVSLAGGNVGTNLVGGSATSAEDGERHLELSTSGGVGVAARRDLRNTKDTEVGVHELDDGAVAVHALRRCRKDLSGPYAIIRSDHLWERGRERERERERENPRKTRIH